MILHPVNQIPVVSFKKLQENAEWLRQFLAQCEIDIEKDSVLEHALFMCDNIPRWSSCQYDFLKGYKLNNILSNAIGLAYLVSIIAAATKYPSFNNIKRLISHITKSNPIMTEKAPSEQNRNFVFELEIACIFAACGLSTNTADEPDVTTINNGTWNLPCKMIYSKNTMTFGDRVKEGITQCLRHPSDFGLVILGITNRLDHDSYMPILNEKEDTWGSFPSTAIALDYLSSEMQNYVNELGEIARFRLMNGRNNDKFRGILIIAHTIGLVNGAPMLLTQVSVISRLALYHEKKKIFYVPEVDLCMKFNNTACTIFSE